MGGRAADITAQLHHAMTALAGLLDCMAREGLRSPALLVIGEVGAHAALDAVHQGRRNVSWETGSALTRSGERSRFRLGAVDA